MAVAPARCEPHSVLRQRADCLNLLYVFSVHTKLIGLHRFRMLQHLYGRILHKHTHTRRVGDIDRYCVMHMLSWGANQLKHSNTVRRIYWINGNCLTDSRTHAFTLLVQSVPAIATRRQPTTPSQFTCSKNGVFPSLLHPERRNSCAPFRQQWEYQTNFDKSLVARPIQTNKFECERIFRSSVRTPYICRRAMPWYTCHDPCTCILLNTHVTHPTIFTVRATKHHAFMHGKSSSIHTQQADHDTHIEHGRVELEASMSCVAAVS